MLHLDRGWALRGRSSWYWWLGCFFTAIWIKHRGYCSRKWDKITDRTRCNSNSMSDQEDKCSERGNETRLGGASLGLICIINHEPNQTWSCWQPFPQSRIQELADDRLWWMATNIESDQISNLSTDKERETYHDWCISNPQTLDSFDTKIRINNTILRITRRHYTCPGRMRRGNCVLAKVCIQLLVGSCVRWRLVKGDDIIFPSGRWKESLGCLHAFTVGENVKFRGKKV